MDSKPLFPAFRLFRGLFLKNSIRSEQRLYQLLLELLRLDGDREDEDDSFEATVWERNIRSMDWYGIKFK